MDPDCVLLLIKEARDAIRAHRDQKGDDRCWLDDELVWLHAAETPSGPQAPPPFDEAMARCRDFYRFRRSETADLTPPDATTDPAQWDHDLVKPATASHWGEYERLLTAIRTHRDVAGRPRTLDDDRALYAVLPERLPADFRLPPEEEFLGEKRAPCAGCPSFWRSHGACQVTGHDLHRWGPCGK